MPSACPVCGTGRSRFALTARGRQGRPSPPDTAVVGPVLRRTIEPAGSEPHVHLAAYRLSELVFAQSLSAKEVLPEQRP
jgi:hypothetical protein